MKNKFVFFCPPSSSGILNEKDNCKFISNSDQKDEDGDNVGDMCDNCPMVRNSDQKDTGGNGVGDACNTDNDSDG